MDNTPEGEDLDEDLGLDQRPLLSNHSPSDTAEDTQNEVPQRLPPPETNSQSGTSHESTQGRETTIRYNRGDKIFAKSGQRPFWPGRILTADHQQNKYQVLLYGLNDSVMARRVNLIPLTEESLNTHGKRKRSNSQWRDAFDAAMLELQTNPDPPLPLPDANNPTLQDIPEAVETF